MMGRYALGLGLGCALMTAAASAPVRAAEEAPPLPLVEGLDRIGLGKPMTDAGITAGGWVEASYTLNLTNWSTGPLAGRVFDVKAQDPTLNQTVLYVERAVDPSKGKFDLGFRIEGLYGSDGRFIHANGLNFYGGDSPQIYPENQLDLTQAYVDVAIPVGSGLKVRAGKMVTHMGYETINPNNDPLYSHSYLFGFAIPFTHTGVMAFYNINDRVSVMGGISRGWEQSLKDNNEMIDFLGQLAWKTSDKLTLTLGTVIGPEATDNNSDYRSVVDLILSYAATDKLSFALNGDYGYESDAAADGSDAQWYGVAGYAGYKITDMMTLQGRLEWFSDPDGARGLDTNVYEATVGLNIKPFPNAKYVSGLIFRPEIRYDYSEDAIFGDDGGDHNQVTLGGDVILNF
ncbi:MAG TPA: porin [Tepidisphaeraceae bacterium]|nr:porin [Tepidisphaeraceae bacterium]